MSAIERFIEEMGLISQDHGGPRIAGRIIGLLMLEGSALSLQQISERLGVSRASVSTNARQLEVRGTLRRTARAGDRQDYYELQTGPHFEMLEEMAARFQRHAKMVSDCATALANEAPQAVPRVRELSNFFDKSAEILQNWAEALRDEQAPGKTKK